MTNLDEAMRLDELITELVRMRNYYGSDVPVMVGSRINTVNLTACHEVRPHTLASVSQDSLRTLADESQSPAVYYQVPVVVLRT